jgi:hypothetical protein
MTSKTLPWIAVAAFGLAVPATHAQTATAAPSNAADVEISSAIPPVN